MKRFGDNELNLQALVERTPEVAAIRKALSWSIRQNLEALDFTTIEARMLLALQSEATEIRELFQESYKISDINVRKKFVQLVRERKEKLK